jgi:hypothetical protein
MSAYEAFQENKKLNVAQKQSWDVPSAERLRMLQEMLELAWSFILTLVQR